MTSPLVRLWTFTKLLIRKWVLWVFFGLDLATLAVDYLWPGIRIPSAVFPAFAIVGLFWASYQIHADSLRLAAMQLPEPPSPGPLSPATARPETYAQPALTPPPPVPPEPTVELFAHLVEGASYHYTLNAPVTGLAEKSSIDPHSHLLPTARALVAVRVENRGQVDAEILGVEGSFSRHLPLGFTLPEPVDAKRGPLVFPVRIGPDRDTLLYLDVHIHPWHSSPAQIAAALRDSMDEEASASVYFVVHRADPAKYRFDFALALRPLNNLYVDYWKRNRLTDLVRLATGREPDGDDVPPPRETQSKVPASAKTISKAKAQSRRPRQKRKPPER